MLNCIKKKNCNIHQKPGQQKIDRLEEYTCNIDDIELVSIIKNIYTLISNPNHLID